jgi:D-alanyl-D-alanine carboxypeptidase
MHLRFGSICLTLALLFGQPAPAADDRAAISARVQAIADDYMANRSEIEHTSGISISISLPGDPEPLNIVAGRVSRDPGSPPITPETLFQIGSITKSFTAVALLQLEAEGRLDLDDTLAEWLPEYPGWKDLTLRRLLNMTSGIPTYDDTEAALTSIAETGLGRHFSPAVLVGYVDPTYPGAPEATTGYAYSNTNYALAGMIIEKVTGRSVQEEFENRFLGERYGLTSTYYREAVYPPEITNRMASGYFAQAELEAMAKLMDADMKNEDMSWAGAAGALVSRPEDVNRWARTLFLSDMLSAEQKKELTTVVSTETGETIGSTSAEHPHGFGLGVSGFTAPLGSGWNYEGGTMGYRVVYVLLPDKDLVATVALNSAPNDADDQIGKLVLTVIEAALP